MIVQRILKNHFLYLFLFAFLLIFSSCTQQPGAEQKTEFKADTVSKERLSKNFFTDCRALLKEAKLRDSILLEQTEIDGSSANNAIRAFTDYANYCHQDSLSPMYLIKCAQVARAVNNIPQAKLVLEKCVQDYPQFKNRPAALFLLAQLYDEPTYLNNEEEAKKLYEQILLEYPKSEWAISAKGAIGFLGKSDAQIMEMLKKGKQKK